MKLIVAMIKHCKLEDVGAALTERGVTGTAISEVKGYGRQSGHTEIYRGAEGQVVFVPIIRLETAVPDSMVEGGTLQETAKSGKVGDGNIFVVDVADAVRIRTGEHGEVAL